MAKEEPKSNNETNEATDQDIAAEVENAKKEEQDSSALKEQLLRLAAEFDNYKKKVKKDIEYSERRGKAALIKDLLPVIDDLEIAILAWKGGKDNLAQGLEMIYSNLMGVLKREGLSVVEVDGVFDPYRHEIVMAVESDEKEGTILGIVKKGYMFDDKLLRPASVMVAKNRKEEKKTEEKDNV